MADGEHIAQLMKGPAAWNAWRKENPNILPDFSEASLVGENLREANLTEADFMRANLGGADLSGANLSKANLFEADLSRANLGGADLSGADLNGTHLTGAQLFNANLLEADLTGADLSGANLRKANLNAAVLWSADLTYAFLNSASLMDACLTQAQLYEANLVEADLTGADLRGAQLFNANLKAANLRRAHLARAHLDSANLSGASLSGAKLNGANLHRANLSGSNLRKANLSGAVLASAMLVNTDLRRADLTGSRVYGVSAWSLRLEKAIQQNLVITPEGEPEIAVDNIEVAQFVYLLLHNEKIRGVIDTITSKAVLILGRFTPERKRVLDAVREELRRHDYLPILFDFDVPANRDITETVSLLAHMARFIIADLTAPSSIPKELEAIVPTLAVPVQALIEGSHRPYTMFNDYWKYDWVLPIHWYVGLETLLITINEKVIAPAEAMVKALEERRRRIETELIKPKGG
jgi:uncharacterized protein YjbI with pentapeptide repeats